MPFDTSRVFDQALEYEDDGFVIRHWRGVVPSNSLACLDGLTEDVRERVLLGEIRTHVIDESV